MVIFVLVCGAIVSMLGYLMIAVNSTETRVQMLLATSLLGFTVSKLNK